MIDILKYSAAETLEKNFQEIKFSLSIELDFKIPNFVIKQVMIIYEVFYITIFSSKNI